ncbi:MAG: hypothetical protein AAGI53_04960 [Planctomycetota bacterium]
MSKATSAGRVALFGGALAFCGMQSQQASGQELQAADGGYGVFTVGGTVCYAYYGDPCFALEQEGYIVWDSSGPRADIAAGDFVFGIEQTPTRFALSRTDRPDDRPKDFLSFAYTYAFVYLEVTRPAIVEYDIDYRGEITLGGTTFVSQPASGTIVLEAGDPVEIVSSGDGRIDARFSFEVIGSPSCNATDIAAPFGLFDLVDIDVFIAGYFSADPIADIAEPFGVLCLGDIDRFIGLYLTGCP